MNTSISINKLMYLVGSNDLRKFLNRTYWQIRYTMNEFLEQLVRDLTNAYSRSQKCLVSVYHLTPQISEAFSFFLVAGGKY